MTNSPQVQLHMHEIKLTAIMISEPCNLIFQQALLVKEISPVDNEPSSS